jgi:hypothetical protein
MDVLHNSQGRLMRGNKTAPAQFAAAIRFRQDDPVGDGHKAVGNVKNDSPKLIEPASAMPESSQNRSSEALGSLSGTSRLELGLGARAGCRSRPAVRDFGQAGANSSEMLDTVARLLSHPPATILTSPSNAADPTV